MTWRIQDWDAVTATGAVSSPHFGPHAFGPDQNRYGTSDFVPGEEVLVELDRDGDGWRVHTVTAARQRQPAGTQTAQLDALNRPRHFDAYVEAQTDTSLRLWLGDCCRPCGPSVFVTFHGVSRIEGLRDDLALDSPWFRMATADEQREHGLEVGPGATAYCIVTNHGHGRDGPRVFVVATGVDVEPCPAPA